MNKLILLLPLLTGCSLFNGPDEPDIVYRTQKIICEDAPVIRSGNIYPVEFVSAQTIEGKQVLGLDGENYSNLALNTRAGIEYIKSQKAYITYLTGCIDRFNENAAE